MIAAARPASIPGNGGALSVNRSIECDRLHGFLLPLTTTPAGVRSMRCADFWMLVPGCPSAKPDAT
jgi:hypothetical protein